MVFKDLILAEDLKLHNGTSFKVDYNDSGDFVYEFYLKEGKDYLKCEKRDKNELFSHCKSFKKVANKNRATAFRVSGLLMDATEEDKKKGRVKKRSIAHIALLSDDLKTRLGVVHKKCFK
ncbi:MAG: hypothetical protein HRT44_03825 [Bdellovibrionales bacterium]|nr:hypothetical protein [Bdellovibrionales bacterium]